MKVLRTTFVTAIVELENGRRYTFAWTTPVPFGRCLGKGGSWAREELAAQKIKGRSKIASIAVRIVKSDDVWGQS